MQFGKRTFFLALNGTAALALMLYVGFWLLGGRTVGAVLRPINANTVDVQYQVAGQTYTGTFMRSDIHFSETSVRVCYQKWNPSLARIDSFMGIVAEPLTWWLVLLLASAMLLLTNNTVFSKGTRFHLHGRFPWLSMDEYFPAAGYPAPNDGPLAKEGKQLPDGWRQKAG